MPPDMCISSSAQVFYGGIGAILCSVIVWLGRSYINYLIEDNRKWQDIARDGTGLAEGAVEVAKKRHP